MGLFHSLSMAAQSLQAQQYAMDVTGQNIANVNTPGYTRRVVDFAEVPAKFGGGVTVQGVRSVRDGFIERRLLEQVPVGAREGAVAEALALVETALGAPGAALDGQLTALFDAFAALADDPASPVGRRQVQIAAESLSSGFAEMTDRLETARRDADLRLRGTVDEINSITTRLAELNQAIPGARAAGSAHSLEDEQHALVRQLSGLVDLRVIERSEGGVDVTLANGQPLVIGESPIPLEIAQDASGYAVIQSGGQDVAQAVGGGALGGHLRVRDTLIPGYQAALDQLAFDTAAQVNALHSAGFDATGQPGGDFFTFSVPPSGVSGAARAIQVSAGIAADNGRIAAAAAPLPGDNGTARAIAGLRTARVLNGNTATLNDAWAGFVYQVGADARAAANARDTQAAMVREVDAIRDQVSGVSLDEEALNLLKFQRAYEANARFFTTVDSMLVTLLNLVK
jgi:flagellar hook-associated protein 1 FlgK